MPIGPASTPPTQLFPDALTQNKTLGLPDMQPEQMSTLIRELEPLCSPPVPRTVTPPIHLQSTTDHYDATLTVSQGEEPEDEYTLCAYGDISLGEVIVPPLPAPTHPSPSPLHPRFPQPRLRLKVRRPPMPKRRLSYTYISGPLPHSRDMDPDERWPGSPRSFVNSSPWLQHQPLVSPLATDSPNLRMQGNKPVKNGCGSLEKLFDEIIPRSPSVRLSPPGSPANQVLGLPQEMDEQKSSIRQGWNVLKSDDVVKLSQSSPMPVPRQDKPRETPWRTRLPPRPPIPKWDI